MEESRESDYGHHIPYKVCETVKDLVRVHKEIRGEENQPDALFYGTFLGYESRASIPENLKGEWKLAKKWFGEFAHCRGKPFPQDVHLQIEKHFRTLHSLLYVAASSEYERLKVLDEFLEETNG